MKAMMKKLTQSKYYPWSVIVMSGLFLLYKYVIQTSPSVMANDLMRTFQINGEELGNLAATFFYSYVVVQLFVGPMLDKFNARLLTSTAIFACAVGTLLFARSDTLLEAELARMLVGAGFAFATISYLKMAAIWLKPQEFALASGLLATAAMLGSMAGQTPLAYLVSTAGWRDALFTLGLAGIVFAIAYYLFVRVKSETSVTETSSLRLKDIINLLKQRHNLLLIAYAGLGFSPLVAFGGLWGNPFLQKAFNLAKPEAASLTSMMFIGLAIGAPLLGFLSDRMKKRYSIMILGILLSLFSLSFALYFPTNSTVLEGIALFLFGFGTGAYMLCFAIGKETNPLFLAATIVGLINTGDAIVGALTEPFVGQLLDLFSGQKVITSTAAFSLRDFHIAFIALPVFLLLAFFVLLLLGNHDDSMKAQNGG